ncbi:lon protease homolog 2, peroxisomal-like [Lycorma delicatula]|uniref:lon protease homolog 2, peroxisomal-like n=1 Tax=Lycorma delicatula TaxID=130591 RepID=UPI003F50E826
MATVSNIPKKLPLLFICNDVLLPGSSMRIPVTTNYSMNMVKSRLLSQSTLSSTIIGVITRKEDHKDIETEVSDGMPIIGTAAVVIQVTGTNWPRPAFTLLVTGICRFQLEKIIMEEPYPVGVVAIVDKFRMGEDTAVEEDAEELNCLVTDFKSAFMKLLNMLDPSPMVIKLRRMVEMMPAHALADLCTSVVSATYTEKLDVLNALDLTERFKKTLPLLLRQIEGLEVGDDQKKFQNKIELPTTIRPKIPTSVSMIKVPKRIRYAIGGNNDDDDMNDIVELQERLRKAKLPSYAQKVATKELKRLKSLGPFSPEHGVVRNYVELMAELPWDVTSPETIDIHKARKDLDEDHYAMEKLKKRVLEYLAVRQLKSNLKGPILCFVGPPGVGKTSVARSIASTLGREFQRISLGGVCNQSDIRGHRRTYIGAMPGRILQAIKMSGVKNPVILLDEIDKLSIGVHGDPAAALLEVLDPEQNCHFVDHFLNVAFDLSQVMFIATANRIRTIPAPLLDRMEVIHVEGYSQEEKLHIAIRHLLPKQLNEHGLTEDFIQVPSDSIKLIINCYTAEGGVRGLERKLSALCRAVAVKVAECSGGEKLTSTDNTEKLDLNSEPPTFPIVLDEAAVEDILGPPIFDDDELWSRVGEPGVAVGLAWTAVGGKVMLVEATKLAGGDGQLILTGFLGGVMKESAKLALNWLRSAAKQFSLTADDGELMSGTDVHIHFPAGAVEKDGPSGGITIATALVSLFSGIPVASDLAMTGELSLRGVVLPVGGIKEKIMAAHRAGLSRVILPKHNEKDLQEVAVEVKSCLKLILVNHMEEVIEAAFDGALTIPQKVDPLTSKL